jgi:hypothetical protein
MLLSMSRVVAMLLSMGMRRGAVMLLSMSRARFSHNTLGSCDGCDTEVRTPLEYGACLVALCNVCASYSPHTTPHTHSAAPHSATHAGSCDGRACNRRRNKVHGAHSGLFEARTPHQRHVPLCKVRLIHILLFHLPLLLPHGLPLRLPPLPLPLPFLLPFLPAIIGVLPNLCEVLLVAPVEGLTLARQTPLALDQAPTTLPLPLPQLQQVLLAAAPLPVTPQVPMNCALRHVAADHNDWKWGVVGWLGWKEGGGGGGGLGVFKEGVAGVVGGVTGVCDGYGAWDLILWEMLTQ